MYIARLIRRSLLVLLAAGVLGLVGCRTAPVMNVESAPVNAGVGAEGVKQAIIRAGASLGWRIKEVGPGKLEGTLNLRSHMAQVDIRYDAHSYDISYKNSHNLKYDGVNIHSNYNGWVQNLDNAIQGQLVGG